MPGTPQAGPAQVAPSTAADESAKPAFEPPPLLNRASFKQGEIEGVVRKGHSKSAKRDVKAPKDFVQTVKLDEQRKSLLEVARVASPATAFRLTSLGSSVFPRVFKCPLTWVTYAACA